MEEEAMIYFWTSKDGDGVYFNTDIEEAKKMITPQSRRKAAHRMTGTLFMSAQHGL